MAHSVPPEDGIVAAPGGEVSINKLPSELLEKILAFLPTKLATSTSLLSRKWRNIWRGNVSTCISYSGEVLVGPIGKTLYGLTRAKISTFHLTVDAVPRRDNDINDWISFAMGRKPDNVSIRFIGGDHGYRFWDEFYNNDCLKQLTLQMEHPDMISNCPVSWPSLTSLFLNCPYLPEKVLANILTGCPLLKSLTLYQCEEQLVYFDLRKATSVRSLDIHTYKSSETVKIEAPAIRYLRLCFSSPCVLVNVSSLKEAKLEIFQNLSLAKGHGFLQDMMLKLQTVEKLTFGSTFLTLLSLSEVHDVPFPTFKVEDLTLETMIVRSVLPGIKRLLQNSPALKQLTIDLVKLHVRQALPGYDFTYPFEDFLSSHGLYSDQMWESDVLAGEDAESELVLSVINFLLQNTTSLTQLVVRLKHYVDKPEFEKLKRMNRSITRKENVSIVLEYSCVRSFTSFFDVIACSEHGT